MGDCAWHFHAEAKCIWYAVGPSGIGLGLMRAVEGRIDFHAGKYLGIPLQMTALCWKRRGDIGIECPPGAADQKHGGSRYVAFTTRSTRILLHIFSPLPMHSTIQRTHEVICSALHSRTFLGSKMRGGLALFDKLTPETQLIVRVCRCRATRSSYSMQKRPN